MSVGDEPVKKVDPGFEPTDRPLHGGFSSKAAQGMMNEDLADRNRPWQELGFWGRLSKRVEQQATVDFRDIAPGMDRLVEKYQKEFDKAAEKRVPSSERPTMDRLNFKFNYDYDDDPFYRQWQEDRQAAKVALGIHWVDDWFDSGREQLRLGMRFFGTAGLAYGLGRSAYLWRTIDRNYARLNGVTLPSILSFEVFAGITKGFFVGVTYGGGQIAGETACKLAQCAYNGDVRYPPRTWWHVTGALCMAGICSAFAAQLIIMAFHRDVPKRLTRLGFFAYGVGNVAFATVVGAAIYKPWLDSHGGVAKYDERKEMPWNRKVVGQVGQFRGRWV